MSEDEQITLAFARARGDKGFSEAELLEVISRARTHLRMAELVQRAMAGEFALDFQNGHGLVVTNP